MCRGRDPGQLTMGTGLEGFFDNPTLSSEITGTYNSLPSILLVQGITSKLYLHFVMHVIASSW